MSRPGWDEYFLKLALLTAERATCHRHHAGAVAVKDRRVIAGGYNGAPVGHKDCLELGCLREGIPSGERTEICRAVHAEENAVIQGGASLVGSTVYCTHPPCRRCAKMLCNARIVRFVTFGKYADNAFRDVFDEAGIKFEVLPKPSLVIDELA